MRKLVTIQKVLAVEPIPDADLIEQIQVLGWKLVCKKNEFKVGDLCIYFEIDSFLPIKPEFEFLRKSCYKKLADGQEGFRLKTAKFKGVISQGLALPLSILTTNQNYIGYTFSEGEEVTNMFEVVKYEPPVPACLMGEARGYIPSFLITDETRVQVLQSLLNKYQNEKFYIAEKLDGSSVTYFIDEDNEMHVCSRQLDLIKSEENSMWKWAIENNIEEKIKSLPFRACFQGEIFGEGIQGNKYKLRGQHVRFFNIINLESKQYLDYEDFIGIILKLKLNCCPILEVGYKLTNNINDLIEKSKGKSFLNQNIEREGIVLRPLLELRDANFDLPHSRLSFKVINPNFLLKFDE